MALLSNSQSIRFQVLTRSLRFQRQQFDWDLTLPEWGPPIVGFSSQWCQGSLDPTRKSFNLSTFLSWLPVPCIPYSFHIPGYPLPPLHTFAFFPLLQNKMESAKTVYMGRVPSLGTGFTGDPKPRCSGSQVSAITTELNQKSLKHQKIQGWVSKNLLGGYESLNRQRMTEWSMWASWERPSAFFLLFNPKWQPRVKSWSEISESLPRPPAWFHSLTHHHSHTAISIGLMGIL